MNLFCRIRNILPELQSIKETSFFNKITHKVKWVVLGQNEKFDLYLNNGNEPFY